VQAFCRSLAVGGQRAKQESVDGRFANFGRGGEMQVPLDDPHRRTRR